MKCCVQTVDAGVGNAEVQSSLFILPVGGTAVFTGGGSQAFLGCALCWDPAGGCCPWLFFLLLPEPWSGVTCSFSWAEAVPVQLKRQELREWICFGPDLWLLCQGRGVLRMRMAARGRPHLRRCLSDHPGGSTSWAWDGFWRTAREKRLAGQSRGSCNPTLG